MIEIHLTDLPVVPRVEVADNGCVRLVMNHADSMSIILERHKDELTDALTKAFVSLWADPNFPRLFSVAGSTVIIKPDLTRLPGVVPQSEPG